ncbi:hypothetical protein [Leptospira noguchii]|nr:hypothetical protein [Leptospira noguchii]
MNRVNSAKRFLRKRLKLSVSLLLLCILCQALPQFYYIRPY